METNEPQVKSGNATRKGLHKFFHVTRLDTYIGILGAVFFLGIVLLKVFGEEISFITWTDALQIALLFGIFGIVARMYYHFFEARYDK